MRSKPITVRIHGDVADMFPAVSVTAVRVSRVRAAAAALSATVLEDLWVAAHQGLERAGVRIDTLAEREPIRIWRDATRRAGLKPSSYRSSVEALARRVLKTGSVQTPLPMVDAYCALSVEYLAPAGVYDIDRVGGSVIEIRHQRGTDRFEPLGGGAFDPSVNVVVYAVGDEVLCWNFNHRDSRATSLTAESDDAILFSESLTPAGRRASADLVQAFSHLLTRLGAPVGQPLVVDAGRREGEVVPIAVEA